VKTSLTMLPYLFVNAMAFYLLPIVIKDTGSAMAILLIVLPLICFVTALVYGAKNSFNLLYTIAVSLLFVPTIYIFFNPTAWVYIVAYGVIVLAGNYIGSYSRTSTQR
jgi:hypothetical protein